MESKLLDQALRREAAIKLIEAGASQRQAAKMLGVSKSALNRDLSQSGTESVPEWAARDEKEAAIRDSNAKLKRGRRDEAAFQVDHDLASPARGEY